MRRIWLALLLPACGGGKNGPADHDPGEDDWSLPGYVVATTNAGLFSEIADPARNVELRVIDVTWRQLEPQPDVFRDDLDDVVAHYEDLDFSALATQLARPGPYWLRFWVSGVDTAPDWITAACPGLTPIAQAGYEDDAHWPIWDSCFWTHAADAWAYALSRTSEMAFAYAPGAFTWSEFDLDLPAAEHDAGRLDASTFVSWFMTMTSSLAPLSDRLVFTGEDYPFGPNDGTWHTQDDLLARDAVLAGMGIRTGITEVFNFHLNHVPAYGIAISSTSGRLVVDEAWPVSIRATENECYADCGFSTDTPYYAVKMSNLKALQMRMSHVYVVPSDSFLDEYPELWEWTRLSLGKTVTNSPDAWIALREWEDRYFVDDPVVTWDGAPFLHNWERWIRQVETQTCGTSERGSDERIGVLAPENGRSWEGRRVGANAFALCFDVDDRFLSPANAPPVEAKITWLDESAEVSWVIAFTTTSGAAATATITGTGDGRWKTDTFPLPGAIFDGTISGPSDFAIVRTPIGAPFEARFVRLVKTTPP